MLRDFGKSSESRLAVWPPFPSYLAIPAFALSVVLAGTGKCSPLAGGSGSRNTVVDLLPAAAGPLPTGAAVWDIRIAGSLVLEAGIGLYRVESHSWLWIGYLILERIYYLDCDTQVATEMAEANKLWCTIQGTSFFLSGLDVATSTIRARGVNALV